ncbi:AAA family ATPase [Brachybacterium sp. EF45031]|uniref:AAA domain-containing protein n=1 Tax=Brachybacterium sillae TaxID=2810536 RepID=UPI00217D5D82|nr:AAA domain-containing protein [Brachybacterium sillae]MCS6710689.1 AAA family ATPase [Brachybacterium sillae]
MDAASQTLTHYFRAIQTQVNLEDRRFDAKSPHLIIPFAVIERGILDESATEELFTAARQPRSKPLDVIISVVTGSGRGASDGLVLLPASLDAEGTLSADLASQLPWIPASRLRGPGIRDREVMVGTLRDFWKWRLSEGEARVSRAEDWDDVVEYVRAMIEGVCDLSELHSAADGVGAVIHRPGTEHQDCWITPGKVITANGAILDLYRHLAEQNPAAPLYDALLRLGEQSQRSEDGIDEDLDLLLASALKATGSMSDGFPLTPSQRRAVHAFLHDGEGDVTAVSGPPGTGKTTMLQAVVATLLVTHALEDRSAPLIVGTSTNNQAVTNVIDSFSSVAKDDAGPLACRWLPIAVESGAGEGLLRGLAAYAPSGAKTAEARAKGYLLADNRKGGVYTDYSTPDYVVAATARFLDAVRVYAGALGLPEPKDLPAAKKLLAKVLRMSEDRRQILLRQRHATDRRHRIDEGSAQAEEQARLTGELDRHAERLAVWRHLGETGPGSALQASLAYDEDEPAEDLGDVAAFVEFYSRRVVELAALVERAARDRAAREEARVRATSEYTAAVTGAVDELRQLCLLDEDRAARLSGASSLLALDQALDVTVRHAQFWLAVHLYEAQWLITAGSEDLIPPAERNRTSVRYMERYWSQLTSLTPCLVMTAFQVPKHFALWARDGEPVSYDLGRIDLLIVDEAGQVDISLAASVFSLARRALVVGDVQQLAPVWSIDPESDREMGLAQGLEAEWPVMESRGLTASQPSSVMRAAAGASRWCYGPDNDEGLFLAEHFRCHAEIIEYCNELLYKGQLIPSRPTTGYRLEGHVPAPFLFREVPGAEDQRRGSSRVNPMEAEAIATWLDEHFDHFTTIYDAGGNPEKEKAVFGVVTPFAAQARLIQNELRTTMGPRASLVTVGTAHTLQGAERSIVLFSSVYGENSGKASFIDGTLELMNVAVSRAKDLFIVFGASARWKDSGPVFSLVRKRAAKYSGVLVSGSPTDIPEPADPPVTAPASPADGDPAETEGADEAVVASVMIRAWQEQGMLPEGVTVAAKTLNPALRDAGLLQKVPEGWEPSPEGAHVGIVRYEGQSNSGPYVNVKYTAAAQAEVLRRIQAGELPLA